MTNITIQNVIDLGNTALADAKMIALSQGQFAIVDACDYEWLNQWKWYRISTGYAARVHYLGTINGKKREEMIRMHRLIMSAPKGVDTDHINGNRLDNRRHNLRLCNRSENQKNSKKRENTTSKYKGVSFNQPAGKWQVHIRDDESGRQRHLGLFSNELEAALAYNSAAIKAFGEFARINVI